MMRMMMAVYAQIVREVCNSSRDEMRRHSHGYQRRLLSTDELLCIWSNDANEPMQSLMYGNTAVMRVTVNIRMS